MKLKQTERFSKLVLSDQDEEGLFRLEEEFRFLFSTGRFVRAPKGFLTDLDSVPRIPFIYVLFKNRSVKGAVVHDFLYCEHHTGGESAETVTREQADDIFYVAMKHEGLPLWLRAALWLGVRLGGGGAWRARHSRAAERIPHT